MRRISLIVSLLCLLLANIFIWQRVGIAATVPQIYFLNVGQGDAIFINTGQHQVLVDGGPDDSVLSELGKVMPAGDRTIDLVVSTHPQADHLVGLLAVLERYRVGEVLATFADYGSSLNTEWLSVVRKSGARMNYVDATDDYNFDDVLFDTLWPLSPNALSNNVNEESVVMCISTTNSNVLLTGDADFSTENNLLKLYPGLSAKILKVAHHGSKTSSSAEFLRQINPAIAVIEVGKNSYGHPTKEALERLSAVGAKIYRTDKNGTVRFGL